MGKFEELRKKRLEKQKNNHLKSKRKAEKKYYQNHHDHALKIRMNANKKRRMLIRRVLGNICVVCGSTSDVVIHHVSYGKIFNPCPTLEDLKLNRLVLVCRSHHRAIHYINSLKNKGFLKNILDLLNNISRNSLKKIKVIEQSSISVYKQNKTLEGMEFD